MNTHAITEYFELRKKQFDIDRRLEELKPAVAEELRKRNRVAQLDGYNLILSTYVAWNYSPHVDTLQKQLTEKKRNEREDGTARIKDRRDMLVLKALRGAGAVREESETYDEWEPEGTPPSDV